MAKVISERFEDHYPDLDRTPWSIVVPRLPRESPKTSGETPKEEPPPSSLKDKDPEKEESPTLATDEMAKPKSKARSGKSDKKR